MHYLKLLLEPLALTMLVWAWVTYRLWRQRSGPWRVSLGVWLAFWFISSPLGANSLLWLLERNYREPAICADFPADAPIVVLGGGKRGASAAPEDVTVLMRATFVRTFAGLALWRQGGETSSLIVSGGGEGEVKEADLMAVLLRNAGVPEARIQLERHSNSTAENAAGIVKLLGDSNRIFLLTSAVHMPRARATFEHQGFDVCPWPVDQQAFLPDFGGLWIPSLRPLQKSSAALHEYKGLLWYALTGQL